MFLNVVNPSSAACLGLTEELLEQVIKNAVHASMSKAMIRETCDGVRFIIFVFCGKASFAFLGSRNEVYIQSRNSGGNLSGITLNDPDFAMLFTNLLLARDHLFYEDLKPFVMLQNRL